jgi:hypothetical protein
MTAQESGYQMVDGVFLSDEMEALSSVISGCRARRTRAGVRHLMSEPAVVDFCRDVRLMELASAWLGKSAVPFRATLFDKSPDSNWLIPWHQDTALPVVTRFESPGWGPWSEKAGIAYSHAPAWALERVIALRVHLDPSKAGGIGA